MSVTCLLQANAVSFKFHSDLSRTSLRVKVVSTATRKRARVYPCVACTSTTDVVVIGAGAAGLTAAYFAAQNGAQVRSKLAPVTPSWCEKAQSHPSGVQYC